VKPRSRIQSLYRRAKSLIVVTTIGGAYFAAFPPALAQAATPICPATNGVSASSLPPTISLDDCDIVGLLVLDFTLGLRVPERGVLVAADLLTRLGSESFQISTSKKGIVAFLDVGDELVGPPVAEDSSPSRIEGGSPGACADDHAYQNLGYSEDNTHHWRFNRGTTPNEVTATEAEGAFRSGTSNITQEYNDCGRPDLTGPYPSAHFDGDTTRRANIVSGTNTCDQYDGYNVVDFGNLGPPTVGDYVLGLACTRATFFQVSESDIRLNKADQIKWTTTPSSPSCDPVNQFDIESIMTHERGHTYGLGHVSETSHGRQTMSTLIDGTCQKSERTLGVGDLDGIEWIYYYS
jgi:hypothetical protein